MWIVTHQIETLSFIRTFRFPGVLPTSKNAIVMLTEIIKYLVWFGNTETSNMGETLYF